MINTLLTFGAKNVNPETLEQTLTIREEVVNEIEKTYINKTLKSSTYQSLIIATRGSGKTHVIKVLYHRLKNNKKISKKSVIAYMSEDEVGIANFTDLMISMLRAFKRYGEPGSENLEKQIMEASLIKDSNKREIFIKDLLLAFSGKRIILLLVENFDKIMKSLGVQGQGSLRNFIHQYNNLSIVATSQNLIAHLQDSKNPFYNFFNVTQLNKLNLSETIKFLRTIAEVEGNQALIAEMKQPSFEGKLRTIYELTDGNHRLLVTFYSFLKAEFKSELSRIFIKVMNDLKPYYEQFVNVLPPQQQKIVKYLSSNRGAASGKEIARACFIEPNVFSKQISLLFEKGLIDKNKSGKDVFYELKEPLMRICFEINENTNGIAKLFVDFLTSFYDSKELRNQYVLYKYGARFQGEGLKQKYENEAVMYKTALNDMEFDKVSFAHEFFEKIDNYSELDNIARSEKSEINKKTDLAYELFKKGNAFLQRNQFEEAIENYRNVIDLIPDDDQAYNSIGIAYSNIGQYEVALKYFLKSIKINPNNDKVYNNLGITYADLKQYQKAIDNYQKAIEINPDNNAAYFNIGNAFGNLKKYEEAEKNFKKAVEIDPENYSALNNLGIVYAEIKQYNDAIVNFQKTIVLNPDDYVYNNLGLAFLAVDKIDNAIEAFQKGQEINPENIYTSFSLLGAYVRINDQNKSKEMIVNLIDKPEDDLLAISLTENVFYNLFRFGSNEFMKSYFNFLLTLIFKEKKDKQLWKALPDSLFDILRKIVDYDKERLTNIEKTLRESLAEYPESIIPLKMFSVGVAYLKHNDKNAIYKLSKEERKLFNEAVFVGRKSNQ